MKISTSILGTAGALAAISFAAAPSVVNAWGDNTPNGRPSYTIEQIKNNALGDTITFNSISDGKIGDEKNFVAASVDNNYCPQGATCAVKYVAPEWYADNIKAEDGKVYTVRLYVHNNSPKGTAAIAEGVKATFALPTTVAKTHNIVGYLDSSNAAPTRYYDEVSFVADQNFYLEYIPGTAKYTNALGDASLSDNVITSGVLLGYETMNGKIPGCYEYDGVVTLNVKVNYALSTKLKQTVRLKGDKEWSDIVDAKIGDEVEYQIEFQNLSDHRVDNVMIRDVLPKNVEYVAGSTKLYNSAYPNWASVDNETLTTTGINIGSYNPKGNAYIRFTGKVVNKSLTGCGAIDQLVNWASSTVDGEVAKDNTIVRTKEGTCAPAPSKPGQLPNTGASDMLPAALSAGAITTALIYFIASRKK